MASFLMATFNTNLDAKDAVSVHNTTDYPNCVAVLEIESSCGCESGPTVITGSCAPCVVQEEKTPLHHAAEDGHLDTVRLFLKDYHADTTVTATVSVTS